MTSSYTSNTGIEKPATGDQSGTWGDTVNVNMDIIDRVLNGVGAISLSGTTHTLTTSDGSLSDGMYRVLVLGGSPSGTNTITVSPNDQDKVFFVKNGTGQSVVFTQGSGANVTLASGDTKIIYCDGAGAGAAVVDFTNDLSMSSVSITGGTIDNAAIGGSTPAAAAVTTLTASGVTTVQAGTALLPSIVPTGDTNTGVWFPAADTVAASTAGVEALRIDSSGNVGIGTTTSGGKFHVKAATNQNFVVGGAVALTNAVALSGVNDAGNGNVPLEFRYATNTAFFDSGAERMRIDSAGNVGIGTTNPGAKLDVNSGSLGTTDGDQLELASFSSTGDTNNSYLRIFTERDGAGSSWETEFTRIQQRIDSTDQAYIQFNGADNMYGTSFGTGTTELMRIDSTGNVGIGSVNGLDKLHVYEEVNSAIATQLLLQNQGAGSNTAGIAFQVTSLAEAALTVYAPKAAIIQERTNSYGRGPIKFMQDDAADANPFGAGDEVMRITSAGNVGIGTTAPAGKLGVTGGGAGPTAYFTQTTAGSYTVILDSVINGATYYLMQLLANGTQTGSIASNGTTTTYGTTSDYRLKENVKPMQNALDTVQRLNPVTYKWKLNGTDGQGFIAHELKTVVPDCVSGEKDAVDAEGNPQYQGVDTSFLVATLTAAIQEQQAMILALTARITALEG